MDVAANAIDWQSARYMPSIDEDVRAIVAVPFVLECFVRLGSLQARLRHNGL